MRQECEASLAAFVRFAWQHVEPARPLVWGWHIDAMVEHLEAVTRGHIADLMINVPPGSSKTLLAQVLWPAWEWICDQHPRTDPHEDGYRPDVKTISATYGDRLAVRKALICRRLLESPWYRKTFAGAWEPSSDQWTAHHFLNDRGGWRMATSPGGEGTGEHADRHIYDDLIKPQDALGGRVTADKIVLHDVQVWMMQTMASRFAGPERSRVLIMQRVHQDDPAGVILREQPHWQVLCIPQHFERKHPYQRVTVLERDEGGAPIKTWKDPRTEEGELMCPARFSADECAKRKRDFGPLGFASQEQQRPTPAGGAIYKREWWKFWADPPRDGTTVISVDCSFKATDTSDYVAIQAWTSSSPDFFLLYRVKQRLDVLQTCEAIASMRSRLRGSVEVLVEDAANGPAVATILQKAIPGIRLVKPLGGKVSRANASAKYHASGNVYLPNPATAPWVEEYIEEHLAFPFGGHDDEVDAQSQAINHLATGMLDYGKMLDTMQKLGFA